MKKIEIDAYEYHELSEQAKRKAYTDAYEDTSAGLATHLEAIIIEEATNKGYNTDDLEWELMPGAHCPGYINIYGDRYEYDFTNEEDRKLAVDEAEIFNKATKEWFRETDDEHLLAVLEEYQYDVNGNCLG